MRLRPCLVHGFDGASRSKALSSQGPGAFSFRVPHCYQHRTAFARGDFAADDIAAKGSDEHVPVIVAAFGGPISPIDISAPSWLLMRVNGFVPHPTTTTDAVGSQIKRLRWQENFA